MFKKMKWWMWLLIIVILILVIGAIYKSRTTETGVAVEYDKVEKRDLVETVSASGKVFPETVVEISSDVSGEIVELEVKEGDTVSRGDVLARIDPEAYQSQVKRAGASLSSAKVQLAQAKSSVQSAIAQKEQSEAQLTNQQRIHQRNKQLFNKGIISEAEYDNSISALETAEANFKSAKASLASSKDDVNAAKYNIESARATLSEIQTSLSRTTIRSPMDGIVSLLNVEEGERVVGTIQMSGTVLMRIADQSSMEAQVEVSENDILNVSLNDKVTIEVDAYYGNTFNGKVTEIANSAANITTTGTASLTSDQVTNFIVTIRINRDSYDQLIQEGKPFPLRPGMSCSVEIQTNSKENVLTVPLAAVTTREKSDSASVDDDENLMEVVFTIENDTAMLQQVVTGIQDRDYIEILNGLKAGQKIASGPYSAVSKKLEDGMKVHKKEEKNNE